MRGPRSCIWGTQSRTCLQSSEREGVDDAHHNDVPDGGRDGDPQPDGVPGHGLLLLLLIVSCQSGGVDASRGVEERVIRAVVIVRRWVHEGSCHHWDLMMEKRWGQTDGHSTKWFHLLHQWHSDVHPGLVLQTSYKSLTEITARHNYSSGDNGEVHLDCFILKRNS